MKNPILTPGSLEFAGKTFTVVFDFEAIAEAEDITDRALLTGLSVRQLNRPTINFVRAMFFASLRRYHPEIDYHQAAAMVTRENILGLWTDLLSCWADARQQGEANEPADPTPRPEESA